MTKEVASTIRVVEEKTKMEASHRRCIVVLEAKDPKHLLGMDPSNTALAQAASMGMSNPAIRDVGSPYAVMANGELPDITKMLEGIQTGSKFRADYTITSVS